MNLRDSVNKALEEARATDLIGKNAEAALTLYLTKDQKQLVDDLDINVRLILMVSQLHVDTVENGADVKDYDGVKVAVSHAVGGVSPRDRLYHEDLGADADFPELSKHEAEIVREFYPEALVEGFE